jgi:hypothetical protein
MASYQLNLPLKAKDSASITSCCFPHACPGDQLEQGVLHRGVPGDEGQAAWDCTGAQGSREPSVGQQGSRAVGDLCTKGASAQEGFQHVALVAQVLLGTSVIMGLPSR